MDVMLSSPYANQDPTGWLMSEIIDGVRAYWDGSKLLSIRGAVIEAPLWFLESLPKHHLDGTLFRGSYQSTMAAVASRGRDWINMRYHVYDCTNLPWPLIKRVEALHHIRKEMGDPKSWVVVENYICRGMDDLIRHSEVINRYDGPGTIIRHPKALYEAGPSKMAFKLQKFTSGEAKVVNYIIGSGRRISALVCDDNGKRFKLTNGLTVSDLEDPPRVGKTIAYKCQGRTSNGIPRLPVYLGVRNDDSI